MVLDGAIGSLLMQYTTPIDKDLWSSGMNVSNPEIVKMLYKNYVDAGAEILTTNTFRTNPLFYEKRYRSISNKELVMKSVSLIKEIILENEIIIAGSNAPAEDCYQIERTIPKNKLEYNHKRHIELLLEAGCDLIWNETQSHMDEIKIICEHCSKEKLTFAINLFFTKDLRLLSGEHLNDVVDFVLSYRPECVGFNCVRSSSFKKYVHQHSIPQNSCFYFNCGINDLSSKVLKDTIEPKIYSEIVSKFLILDPLIVGSCCGSNPNHTKAIRALFDEIYRN
jgi:homocysteine S-methyltransferase